MKFIYILIVIQLLSIASYSQTNNTWFFLNVSNGDSTFVKRDYQAKTDEGIKNWTKTIKKRLNWKGKSYDNAIYMTLDVYDCEGKRSKAIQLILYNNSKEVIDSYVFKDYEQKWVDIIPETLGELILTAVCTFSIK